MKNLNLLTLLAIAVIMVFVSCNNDNANNPATSNNAVSNEISEEEANKEIAKTYINYVNERNWDQLSTMFSDNYVYHSGDGDFDRTQLIEMFSGYAAAFDMKPETKHLIAEDDMVAYHLKISGKHVGDFQGMPATNKNVDAETIGFVRIKDGKIVEEWENFQEIKLMRQIGAIPEEKAEAGK